MEFILQWVAAYGYIAIFCLLMFGIIGLPIPDETMMVFAGYLIWKGHLHPVATVATAFFGSMCGITCSYIIGRTLGLGFIHKYGRFIHLDEHNLAMVHRWFDRIGHWALFVGYYVAGVRHFTAILAGTSCLEFRSFAAYAWSGAFIWVCTFLGIGYYFGEQWEQVAGLIHGRMLVFSFIAVSLATAYGLYRWKKWNQRNYANRVNALRNDQQP